MLLTNSTSSNHCDSSLLWGPQEGKGYVKLSTLETQDSMDYAAISFSLRGCIAISVSPRQ